MSHDATIESQRCLDVFSLSDCRDTGMPYFPAGEASCRASPPCQGNLQRSDCHISLQLSLWYVYPILPTYFPVVLLVFMFWLCAKLLILSQRPCLRRGGDFPCRWLSQRPCRVEISCGFILLCSYGSHDPLIKVHGT
jgi:hypothetical protein